MHIIAKLSAHDRHVGLRLGSIVQGDRSLSANVPPLAERASERALGEADGGEVRRALGLGHHQQAVDQLDALAGAEHALLDEPLVFGPPPAFGPEVALRHFSSGASSHASLPAVNVAVRRHWSGWRGPFLHI